MNDCNGQSNFIQLFMEDLLMAMRDDILAAIQAGGATKELLLVLTGTTEKGLASQMTYLRMMGNCPMKQDDGTYKIVSIEEWEAHRASGGSQKVLSPKERLEKAVKREKRAASAYDNAKKRSEDNPDKLAELKFMKADCELEIAGIELGKAQEAFDAAPSEETPEPSNEELDEVVDEIADEIIDESVDTVYEDDGLEDDEEILDEVDFDD